MEKRAEMHTKKAIMSMGRHVRVLLLGRSRNMKLWSIVGVRVETVNARFWYGFERHWNDNKLIATN